MVCLILHVCLPSTLKKKIIRSSELQVRIPNNSKLMLTLIEHAQTTLVVFERRNISFVNKNESFVHRSVDLKFKSLFVHLKNNNRKKKHQISCPKDVL